ncbi:WD40 repeat domain-containing protein [Candidatus Dependentiae bacterium]|nr:WD40 repeat domain-containing protein [Candidatus Dependentiae bacterium]
MKYITRQCTLLVLGLMIGSYAQAMEVAAIPSSTSSMLDSIFPQDFPRGLRWYIISLFLELELSYNFTCSKQILIEFSVAQAFSRDGKKIITGFEDGTAWIVEVATRRQLHILKGHTDRIISVAFSPDGTTVLTRSRGVVNLWDVKRGQLVHTLHILEPTVSLAMSPKGNPVLMGALRDVRLWDVKTGQHLYLEGHIGPITSVAFSPDGRTAITGSGDRTARLWDVTTGQQLHILKGHRGYIIASVAYSPDGTTALTGSDDNTARLWDITTGKELHILEGHTDEVSSVAYCPAGRTVLTGSRDNTARLWDAKTGQQLHILEHKDWVRLVLFSSSHENSIFTVSAEKTANNTTVTSWSSLGRSLNCIAARRETAKELLVMKFCPKVSSSLNPTSLSDAPQLYASNESSKKDRTEGPSGWGFSEAANLTDAPQQGCSIQ